MGFLEPPSCSNIIWCFRVVYNKISRSDTARITNRHNSLQGFWPLMLIPNVMPTWAATNIGRVEKSHDAHRHVTNDTSFVWVCRQARRPSAASASNPSAARIIARGSWWTVRSHTGLFPLFSSFLPLSPGDTDRRYGSTLCSPCMEINCILHSVSSVTNLLQ